MVGVAGEQSRVLVVVARKAWIVDEVQSKALEVDGGVGAAEAVNEEVDRAVQMTALVVDVGEIPVEVDPSAWTLERGQVALVGVALVHQSKGLVH